MEAGLLASELALLKAIMARSRSQHGPCTYYRKLQQVRTGLPAAGSRPPPADRVVPQVRRCLEKLLACSSSAAPTSSKRRARQTSSR